MSNRIHNFRELEKNRSAAVAPAPVKAEVKVAPVKKESKYSKYVKPVEVEAVVEEEKKED